MAGVIGSKDNAADGLLFSEPLAGAMQFAAGSMKTAPASSLPLLSFITGREGKLSVAQSGPMDAEIPVWREGSGLESRWGL